MDKDRFSDGVFFKWLNQKEIYKKYDNKGRSRRIQAYLDELHENYIATRPGTDYGDDFHGLFGYINENSNVEKMELEDIKKYVANKTLDGVDIYKTVISLSESDAIQYGYTTKKAWKNLLLERVQEIGKEFGIKPENLEWTASYHSKKNNPHCHLLIWNKNQNLEIQKNNDAVVWQETVYVPSNEENSYNEDTNQEEVSSATVILKNISETGYITIIKQDADTGASISGAYVSIRDESGNYYNELGLKCPSDESLIPVGISGTSIRVPVDHTYTVSEVTAPTGYYSVSKQAELGMVTYVSGITVKAGATENVILTNKKLEPGKARIIKKDVINSSIQLRGTRVTIRDQEGSYYDSYGREYSYAVSIEVPEDGLLIDKLPKQKEKQKIKIIEKGRIVFGKDYIPISDSYKQELQNYVNKHTI